MEVEREVLPRGVVEAGSGSDHSAVDSSVRDE